MIEQRKNKRFEMRLPLKLVRKGIHPIAGDGETLNVSSRGVLFASSTELPANEPIEYVITFTSDRTASTQVDLHCLGKVIRATQAADGPSYEIAATLERYEFVREE